MLSQAPIDLQESVYVSVHFSASVCACVGVWVCDVSLASCRDN